MRYLRLLLISFITLFLIVTGMSLFIPSHIRVSKAINLKANKDSLMAELSKPENWRHWYPGADSAKPYVEGGRQKGVLFDDNAAHPVSLVVDTISTDEVIAEFKGKNLNPVVNGWKIINYPQSDSTTLQWYMDFHLRWYPWEKFASLLIEKSYGPKMEAGLQNICHYLQNQDASK